MQTVYKKIIIFIQTDLHEIIAKKITPEFNPDDVLLLDLRNFSFKHDGRNFFIKTYGLKGIIHTLNSFRINRTRFECDLLIGNLLTNYNSFFIISAFRYKKLILIDDGIGTPVILKHPDFYNSTLKYQLKNLLLKSLFPLFLNTRFKTIADFISDIKFYYTIYSFKSEIPGRELNIFNESLKILPGIKCIIGQPLVELGQISKEKYQAFISEMIKREGPVNYYSHPMETFLKTTKIEGLTYFENRQPVEKLFEEYGIPGYIFSFYSSSLLHLKKQNPDVNIFYIKNNCSISSSAIFESYEMFFEQAGIQKYPLTLIN